jgi:CheY-like chemotaxis protein
MFLEDVLNMCDRIMRQAAEENPTTPCLQSASASGIPGTANGGENHPPLHTMPTILLVENEPALLDGLREALEQWGYAVLTAASGESAIRICREHNATIDILLSDVLMEGVDGFKVAETVKSAFPDVVVLLMSGSPIDSFPPSSIPHQFLEKPFTRQELLTAISRHTRTPAQVGATHES